MRRKKRPESEPAETPVLPPVPDKLSSPFAALAGVKLAKPEAPKKAPLPPPPPPRTKPEEFADRLALRDALAGVRPLAQKQKTRVPVGERPPPRRPVPSLAGADDAARARLASLVGDAVSFEVFEDAELVEALRKGADTRALVRLRRADVSPEETLDLHGKRESDAIRDTERFVRASHRRGLRTLCIVHGKGLHSEGAPVLRDAVVGVLTRGGAAPLVLAIATPPPKLGGSGAVLVQLIERL